MREHDAKKQLRWLRSLQGWAQKFLSSLLVSSTKYKEAEAETKRARAEQCANRLAETITLAALAPGLGPKSRMTFLS